MPLICSFSIYVGTLKLVFHFSGTHWLWEVTSMLLNQTSDRVKLIKETAMLEGISQEQFNNIPSPRVLNTHLPFSLLQNGLLKHKCKIIFVQRNPKDICVSFYNHHCKILEYEFNGTWENYVQRFMKGLGKTLFSRYENLACEI